MLMPMLIALNMERYDASSADEATASGAPETCQVCGRPALTHNFGADACKACAAFFRRAVTGRRQYLCNALKTCGKDDFQNFRVYPSCKRCRFRKCVAVGMHVDGSPVLAAVSLSGSVTSDESPLNRVASFRSSIFLRRVKLLSENGNPLPVRFQRAVPTTIDPANKAELRLLCDFLSFADVRPYIRHDISLMDLASHFFCVWNVLEVGLTTMRNQGHLQDKLFFVDETAFPIEVETLERHFGTWRIADSDILARDGAEKWKQSLTWAERLQRKNLEAAELAAFTQLLFAVYEVDMFLDERTRKEYVGTVLRDLNDHCLNASKDFAVVFDIVASLLVDFREAFKLFCEIHTMHDLLMPDPLPADRFVLLRTFRFRKRFAGTLM